MHIALTVEVNVQTRRSRSRHRGLLTMRVLPQTLHPSTDSPPLQRVLMLLRVRIIRIAALGQCSMPAAMWTGYGAKVRAVAGVAAARTSIKHRAGTTDPLALWVAHRSRIAASPSRTMMMPGVLLTRAMLNHHAVLMAADTGMAMQAGDRAQV